MTIFEIFVVLIFRYLDKCNLHTSIFGLNNSDMIYRHSKHCVKSVLIRSFSGSYFPAFRLNTEIYGVSCRFNHIYWKNPYWKTWFLGSKWCTVSYVHEYLVNQFRATGLFVYSVKTKKYRFFDVFRGSRKRPVAWKVSKYGIVSGPYFPVFGLNTGKYGPEITPCGPVAWNGLIQKNSSYIWHCKGKYLEFRIVFVVFLFLFYFVFTSGKALQSLQGM